ncbi:AsnC family transcriptional regulator [Amylibacter ulvae]|uniref:AsnC family transcriptional regulator n=1 Tax=Paramylibacter ulvae TaxID=1651968 RepID=A0ABQ3D6G5_9RHOB|nr:Lrp/AsnC family transcriptional regulator [Amylibacter ulvae]GHA55205.1 AsnC family transcriptional regulator [Amylibacter ulvae]
MQQLDDLDRRILRILQDDANISSAELAERAGASAPSCWRRVERMQADGVILDKRVEIDAKALGFAVEVSLRITLDKTQSNAFDVFINAARDVPEVSEIQTFLGRVDVRLTVLARDMPHYQEIYRNRILALPHIADIEALMLVADVMKSERLPL